MEIYEITGLTTGVSQAGVNYLQPVDSFQEMVNGFIYRQVLQSRQGVGYFAPRLAGNERVFGIFEHTVTETSTKELLVFDKNQAYKYNIATGVFDPIPFGGSMAAYTGFNISSNDFYISGTTYPTATNGSRFVFSSKGITANAAGSSLFFYNGTDIQDFTSVVDNPNYVAPPQGAIRWAEYVIWFNERLNLISPRIASTNYPQGILYSGIRTASGNGDNFNVAGSGLFQADTYQYITGASILGQILVINFDRMVYTLEKTTDAFNPYFGRSVPGVLGTNAKYSAVSWDDKVVSLGRTGILSTDGRQNLRTDNKIPYFTRDQIDQKDFNLTYGGFDRINNQFLWSYKLPESDTDTQNSVLVKNYEEDSWAVYDQRFSVFGQSDLGIDLTWADIYEVSGDPSWATWDTTEDIWDNIGLGESVQKTLAGDDLGFIYEINKDYDDYYATISAVATGSTTTLTVSATAILAGDQVTISGVQGMLNAQGESGINNFDTATNEFLGSVWNVLSATATSIVIDCDSTALTAYTPSTGHITKIINFSAKTIPFNPYRSEGRRVFVSHVEFLLDINGGNLHVDVFADEEETPFKRDIPIIPDQDKAQAREWITMSVDQEANFLTFLLKQSSPAVQLRLTSMRIHAKPGGLTTG